MQKRKFCPAATSRYLTRDLAAQLALSLSFITPNKLIGINSCGYFPWECADIVTGTNDKSCNIQKETHMHADRTRNNIDQGDDAPAHASQAHAPLPGTNPPPKGTGISGQQNADTPDVSTHAVLHV
jgi:hypothetical protein